MQIFCKEIPGFFGSSLILSGLKEGNHIYVSGSQGAPFPIPEVTQAFTISASSPPSSLRKTDRLRALARFLISGDAAW